MECHYICISSHAKQWAEGKLYWACVALISPPRQKKLLVLLAEVSNQQVAVRRLTSERDASADSPACLFHLELAWHWWLTAQLLIIYPARSVWRSRDHLLGRWEEVALSSNIHWPAVLPVRSQNTQSPPANTAQICTQRQERWYSWTVCEGLWLWKWDTKDGGCLCVLWVNAGYDSGNKHSCLRAKRFTWKNWKHFRIPGTPTSRVNWDSFFLGLGSNAEPRSLLQPQNNLPE